MSQEVLQGKPGCSARTLKLLLAPPDILAACVHSAAPDALGPQSAEGLLHDLQARGYRLGVFCLFVCFVLRGRYLEKEQGFSVWP